MSAAHKSADEVAALVRSGMGVSQLRRQGVTPQQTRAAGFSFADMARHLGDHLLLEAGFAVSDFVAHGTPLANLVKHFPLRHVRDAAAGRFALADYLAARCHPAVLRAELGYDAADFVAAAGGTLSRMHLRHAGFSEQEVGAALASAVVPEPTALQPPAAVVAAMLPGGEAWRARSEFESSTFLERAYRRIDAADAAARLTNDVVAAELEPAAFGPRTSSAGGGYAGSGRQCPRCGGAFVCVARHTSSDGMCGVERGTWVCDAPACGMLKEESAETYGSIF